MSLFSKDPPSDSVTASWSAARASLEDTLSRYLGLSWYDYTLPGWLLDTPIRQDEIAPYRAREDALDQAWQDAIDQGNDDARRTLAASMAALAQSAADGLLESDGSPRKSLGTKVEDTAKEAAKDLAIGAGLGLVLLVAGFLAIAYVTRRTS